MKLNKHGFFLFFNTFGDGVRTIVLIYFTQLVENNICSIAILLIFVLLTHAGEMIKFILSNWKYIL